VRAFAAEVGRGVVVRGQDRAGEPDHRLAVGRERDGVGVAEHEHPPDRRLQLADVLADRRLPDAEAGGGLGEAAGLGHREEGAQLGGVVAHHVPQ
jgi:hypothetical protein